MRYILLIVFILFCMPAFAQTASQLKYPISAKTSSEKIEFCYIAQEKLRFEHNVMAGRYNKGRMSQEEFDDWFNNNAGLTDDMKQAIVTAIATDGILSEEEWLVYKEIFFEKEAIIIDGLLEQKEALKKSTKYAIDLKDLKK